MKAQVVVRLKKEILDPQGQAVNNALHHLGLGKISDVRIGKIIEMDIDTADVQEVETIVQDACKKLLSNPVIEEFSYELSEEKK